MMRGIKCWLIFLLLSGGTLRALGGQPYIFHHLTTQEGLSNNNVRTILKDQRGFLWVGTESGLNRYDGYGFKIFTMNPGMPNALQENDILELQEDGMGNIWIRESVYTIYNQSKEAFNSDAQGYLGSLGITVEDDYIVYVDKRKDLWIITGTMLNYYNTSSKELKTFTPEYSIDLTSVKISDDAERLYVLLNGLRLTSIDKNTGKQSDIPISNDMSLQDKELYVDYSGGIWVFSQVTEEVYYLKNEKSAWQEIKLHSSALNQSNIVLDIMDDTEGHIWIGTDHEGLFIYDKANIRITNLLEERQSTTSIASNNVGCLYRDDEGIVWMGHYKRGVSYYHSSFQNIVNSEHPECRDVNIIMEDSKGNIWLGTDGNGLFQQSMVNNSISKQLIGNEIVVSLLEDKRGSIWIGTYLKGLYYQNNGQLHNYTTENSNLLSNDIWCLKEDRYGNIWIGTLAGGLQYLPNNQKDLHSLITVSEEVKYPMDMYYDGGDKLYVASVKGLYIVDIATGSQTLHIGNRSGSRQFKQPVITSVQLDKKGDIWLGHKEGLTYWNLQNDSLYYIDKEQGLIDNVIRGIVEDNNGNIWVTTSSGLSILVLSKAAGDKLNVEFRNFTTKDGLMNNYFNQHAICKLQSGDILLGGTDGFTKVNPIKMMDKKQSTAKVTFTSLTIGNDIIEVDSVYHGRKLLNKPLAFTDTLVLKHNDRMISLQFTTGDLLYANKIKYAYMLEGLSSQWLTLKENNIKFSSLPAGDYQLYIKAANSDGVWSDESTRLTIMVTPPFYLSNRALAAYVFLALLVMLMVYIRNKARNHKKLQMEKARLEREHETNINEMKLRFFTSISHDLRTPLTLITTPLQTILGENIDSRLRKKLETVNNNAELLLSQINTLLDFRKLDAGGESLHLRSGEYIRFIKKICEPFTAYASDRKIMFSLSHEMETLMMRFDPEKVQKTMLNILSNAFKFTPDGGQINVHVYKNRDQACVSVADSGPGIKDEYKKLIFKQFYQVEHSQDNTGSGIGLFIANEYAQMHGGTISVQDNVPTGCIFTLSLPAREVEVETEPRHDSDNQLVDTEEGLHIETSRKTLLFVDDNAELCEFMSDILSDEFMVIVAYNGQEAIEQLQKRDIDIVVSDIMMPVMSGTELCNFIKTNIQWSHIPVILLTARTADEYRLEGLKMGADDYLTKPFNFNMLKLRIYKFLEWTEKCHASFSQKLNISPSEITITTLDEKLIEQAIAAVEQHISDPEFSVEELGREVGLSRSHLYKKLMVITGKGPSEFIRTIRLKRGRQLLEKSQLQIAEIAYSVGFNSPKRFTINFKNEFGVSPSDYLKGFKE